MILSGIFIKYLNRFDSFIYDLIFNIYLSTSKDFYYESCLFWNVEMFELVFIWVNIDCEIVSIFLGGIDASTHFFRSWNNTSPVDDFYSGTKAALAGGTTMISKFQLMFSLWLVRSRKRIASKLDFESLERLKTHWLIIFI